MTDFDAEIAALEKQIADAKAAKDAASADAAKAARIAELKTELAALGETAVIAAPFQSPVNPVTQVGTEPYHVVPPQAAIEGEGTIVPVPVVDPTNVSAPAFLSPASTIVPVEPETPEPPEEGLIKVVES